MSTPPSDKPKLGARHQILLRLERFSRQRYWVVFLGALVFAAVGVLLGSRLSIESDILALIPEGNRQVDTFKEAIEDFGAVSYLLVLLEAGGEHGPDELEDFADQFASSLAAHEELIDRIEYRLEPDADVLELFFENALLFLPPEQLPELEEKLTDEAISSRMHENRLLVASPMGEFTAGLMQKDPLGLMPLFLNRLFGNRRGIHVDMSDGYYLSRDGRKLIMLVKPTGAWQDMSFNEQLLAATKTIEADVRREFAEDGQAAAEIGVRYSGHYAIAVDEAKLIRQDVSRNLLVSLIAVSALYWICYRRFAALLYSSVPLLVGQAMTFGLAFGVLGSLNAASSAFTALLMGLGTDFVIVMYARYVEERRHGRTLGEATELMVGETGLGVFTGAITSAGTFYAMCISDFRGLRDLGFLIGSGILLCAVAIVFLVPAMIKWNEGVRKRKVESLKKLHVQSFLLEHLIPFSARHRVAVIGMTVVLTGISGYLATQIGFDDTVQVLRSNRSQAIKVQEEIAEEFGASLSFMMAISEGRTSDEAIELAQKIESRLAPFLDEGVVSSYDSILGYLPPESQQREVLLALEADTTRAFDPARIRDSILQAADAQGFRADAFSGFLDRMELFLTPSEPISVTDLEDRGLGHLVQRYVRRDGDEVRIVSYMTMSDPRWKREPPPGLVEDLTGDDPGIVVTGTNVVGVELRRIFSVESRKAVALGLVVVLVLLLIDFRSLKLTLVALAQLVCGVVMMLGLMQVFGYRLNYVNAFVATMILGVGIDYSIHLVHRMSLTGGEVDSGLLETGKAVVIAAFTNIAAFGTLALGNYPALRSFGVVATFGSATCLFTALTLVPALMARPREELLDLFMLWTALLLGIVEGLTEFLPISSTGHLILTEKLIGFEGPRAEVFAIFIQLGAILAVVWEYRSRLIGLARDVARTDAARKQVMKLFLAFIPSAIAGLLLHEFMVRELFFARTVAAALITGGVLILIVERLPLRVRTRDLDAVGWGQALSIGLAQCLALWPGFSRSAATILGGVTVGLDRRTATEFSFFLAIPTMFAAAGYDLTKNYGSLASSDLAWLALSFAVAFVVALATIRWFLRFVSDHGFQPFAWYRLALGTLILLFFQT